jgi:glycosyltransferase involved in cell wall biosynthesis
MNLKKEITSSRVGAPVHVLQVAPDPKIRFAGGPTAIARSIMGWSNYFRAKGIELCFFNSVIVDRNNSSQGKWTIGNIRNFLAFRREFLKRILRGEPADIVHLHSSCGVALLKDLLVAEEAAWRTKTVIAVHVHYAGFEEILPSNLLFAKLTLWLMRYGRSNYILLSNKDREKFIKESIDSSRLKMIPNFHFIEEMPSLSHKQIEADVPLKLLFLGSLGKRKGITDLMRSLEGIENSKYKLHIAGTYIDDETESEVSSLIAGLGLEASVVFHGFTSGEEKEALMRATDVLLLPSYGEGMPVVILEAFSYGICVVSTPVGAIPEVVEHNQNGLLNKPGDITAIRATIQELVDDREHLNRLKRNAYQSAQTYSPQGFRDELTSTLIEWAGVNFHDSGT